MVQCISIGILREINRLKYFPGQLLEFAWILGTLVPIAVHFYNLRALHTPLPEGLGVSKTVV